MKDHHACHQCVVLRSRAEGLTEQETGNNILDLQTWLTPTRLYCFRSTMDPRSLTPAHSPKLLRRRANKWVTSPHPRRVAPSLSLPSPNPEPAGPFVSVQRSDAPKPHGKCTLKSENLVFTKMVRTREERVKLVATTQSFSFQIYLLSPLQKQWNHFKGAFRP